jgi:hypothetical protein
LYSFVRRIGFAEIGQTPTIDYERWSVIWQLECPSFRFTLDLLQAFLDAKLPFIKSDRLLKAIALYKNRAQNQQNLLRL